MTNSKRIIAWALRLLATFIMVQSLFFKFSAAEESIYIFSTLGMEPWGRIGTGIIELFASVLLLIPRTTWLGAIAGIGTMSGAIFFHLTTLGIEVQRDGGQLFIYAVVTLICCGGLLIMDWQKAQKALRLTFSK
jgi:uncharacterized membrane protein YphA (DoxX/SURF4 family)